MEKIKRVNWGEAYLTDPPLYTVYFEDGTMGDGTESEINAELERQKEWDYVKNPITISKPLPSPNNAVDEVKKLMTQEHSDDEIKPLRNCDVGDDEDF